MSNKRKIRNLPELHFPPERHLSDDDLQDYVDNNKPDHPDYHTMLAAMQHTDEQLEAGRISIRSLIKEFCDPDSLVYLATQRSKQQSDDIEAVKDMAAMFLYGFITACQCQDRAVIDMNGAKYEEYERDEQTRQTQFDDFRRQSSDIFTFQVDRGVEDEKTFSKGSLEWLHDLLWLFLAARISAHWDRNGSPCRSLTVNVQVDTE